MRITLQKEGTGYRYSSGKVSATVSRSYTRRHLGAFQVVQEFTGWKVCATVEGEQLGEVTTRQLHSAKRFLAQLESGTERQQ